MREMHWRPGDWDLLTPRQQRRLLWLLTAEKIAAKLPLPTGEYKDPEAVAAQVDLALNPPTLELR